MQNTNGQKREKIPSTPGNVEGNVFSRPATPSQFLQGEMHDHRHAASLLREFSMCRVYLAYQVQCQHLLSRIYIRLDIREDART